MPDLGGGQLRGVQLRQRMYAADEHMEAWRRFWEMMEDSELHRLTNMLGDMAEELMKKKKNSVRKLRTEAEEYLSRTTPNVGTPVQDGLLGFILKTFDEELIRDAKKRFMYPEVEWGPSIREQFGQARKEVRFRENLEHIRKLYGRELNRRQMRAIAFVRTDRMTSEKLREEAEDDEQVLSNGFWVSSKVALLSADIRKNRSLYLAARRRRVMIQTNGQRDALMMREANMSESRGA